MAYQKFDYKEDSIIKAINDLHKKLNNKKSARSSVFRRKSYGIEQICVTTGLPASRVQDSLFLSRESCVKRDWSDDKKLEDLKEENSNSISRIIEDYSNKGYKFTKELEDLTTAKGENSYIAIVSLDGNKMGQKIQHMIKEAEEKEKNSDDKTKSNDYYRQKLKKFSKYIKNHYETAFRYMLDAIHENYSKYENIEKKLNLEEKNEKDKDNKKLMPVRPIILAGDDVCFVCNAKIALECVNLFITRLNKESLEGEQLNACAGICMLKSSYPFDKGYEIAENLCKNGKVKIVDSNDASLVDFHICQGEISTSLNEIRSSVHINKDVELNIKPFYINITEVKDKDKKEKKYERIITKENTFNTYDNFKIEFKRIEEITKDSKGKIRKLRDIFPQGEKQTRLFMNKNLITDKFNCGFNLPKGKVNYGFYEIDKKKTCLYFDIIELQDMFISFEKKI